MAWFLVVRTIRRQVDRPAQEDAVSSFERSGYLPLETVGCLDHERVDVRDISMAGPYSLTGSGECKTAPSTSAVSPLPMQL